MVELPTDLFLTAAELPAGDSILTFIDEGEIRTAAETGFKSDTFQIKVKKSDGGILTIWRKLPYS